MSKQDLSQTALKRLHREQKIIEDENTPDVMYYAKPQEDHDVPIYKHWDGYLYIRNELSLYYKKLIQVELTFPMDYPLSPPKLRFVSNIFHPNIYKDGKICISILEQDSSGPIGCGSPEDRWSPINSIRTVLLSTVILLDNPNIDSPANVDASVMFRDDRPGYEKKVRREIEEQHRILINSGGIDDVLARFDIK